MNNGVLQETAYLMGWCMRMGLHSQLLMAATLGTQHTLLFSVHNSISVLFSFCRDSVVGCTEIFCPPGLYLNTR